MHGILFLDYKTTLKTTLWKKKKEDGLVRQGDTEVLFGLIY